MKTRLFVMLGAALFASSSTAQTPTFSARLDVVRVDALVTESGQIVRGLRPEDFDIVDNGVTQQADLASFEELPLNVVLAFDMSESVSGDRLEHLLDAGRAALDGLKRDDRAGLLTFSHKLTLRQDLTGDLALLRTALDDARPTGRTALVDGTYAALLVGEADAGRDLLIVFSDGLDTASWLTPESVLDSARRSEVTVYAVSMKQNGRSEFLERLAQATGGAVVEVDSTRDLSRTFVSILTEFRQRYVVSYSPRGVEKEGWHKLQVRVKGRRATVKARAGYWGAMK
jgi:Ca-activated chloride channel family protein